MKEIPLTQGKFALVDDKDFEWLSQWKWCASKSINTYYAGKGIRKNNKQTTIQMHSLILNPPVGMETDHINRNGLDNRRDNLRLCTRSQNNMNSEKRKNNTSGYKGVCWNKDRGRWHANITVNYKHISLGLFKNEEQAALVYNEAAKKYFGEFARLNILK